MSARKVAVVGLHLIGRELTIAFLVLAAWGFSAAVTYAQTTDTVKQSSSTQPASSETSTDLFVMFGSDLDRPGLLPRANYNIGIGHTFGVLKKDPFGDELTFGYTYENAGTHGFLHTDFGEHTESAGLMKNFSLPKI